jgi:hypothetical protein
MGARSDAARRPKSGVPLEYRGAFGRRHRASATIASRAASPARFDGIFVPVGDGADPLAA